MGEDGILYTTPLQAISEEQLKAANEADAVVAIVRVAASVFSAEELINSQAEISEESLEGVAGGIVTAGMNCTGNLPGGPFTSRFHC